MIKKFFTALVLILIFAQISFAHELTIMHSNDIHGRIEPIEYVVGKPKIGGWSRRTALIKQIKKQKENTLVVDAGDLSQGSVYYQLFDGVPDMKFLQDSGYDAMAVGNHELDNGISGFENLVKFVDVPLLSANLDFKNNFYLNGKVKSHIVKTYDGFKVGIIGMTTPAMKKMSSASEEFDLRDYNKTLDFLVEYLEDDVDLLVLLSHSGYQRDLLTAEEHDEIDVIVGGHSHDLLKKPKCIVNDGHKTIIVQAGEFGLYLGKLDLEFDEEGVSDYEYNLIPLDNKKHNDKKVASEIKKLNREVKKISGKVIGKAELDIDARKSFVRSSQCEVGVLVNKAMKSFYPEADLVITNAGSIRSHKVIPKGKITQMDIMEMLPFPNKMLLLELSGSDILEVLGRSLSNFPHEYRYFLQTLGVSYSIKINDSKENSKNLTKNLISLKNVKINGKPLKKDNFYKVLTTDYLYNGGDGYDIFRKARLVSRSNYQVTNAVINYIKKEKKIFPKVEDYIEVEE